MMKRQAEAQVKYHTSTQSDIDKIQWNVLALTDELHEALNEVSWRPWQTAEYFRIEAFKNELIDAFHFMLNLFELAGMDEEEVAERFFAKREKNDLRQERGYTGTDKCLQCNRALDDDAIDCTPERCAYQ